MTTEQALKLAFEWYKDITDGRPTPCEAEAARVLRDLYFEHKRVRELIEANKKG